MESVSSFTFANVYYIVNDVKNTLDENFSRRPRCIRTQHIVGRTLSKAPSPESSIARAMYVSGVCMSSCVCKLNGNAARRPTSTKEKKHSQFSQLTRSPVSKSAPPCGFKAPPSTTTKCTKADQTPTPTTSRLARTISVLSKSAVEVKSRSVSGP